MLLGLAGDDGCHLYYEFGESEAMARLFSDTTS